ncbi:hypothetical protein FB45DRAFT_1013890 [Roridomyces roridus]|uniref:F-box domain-containing protein n=1 Tax=Roridomyces roridus TaxID=1738132 RepID=A0AAD7AXT4_9AGAR|nr:hypothetical protein FB45DRAFT_1013890 [Roridomyces roridus]
MVLPAKHYERDFGWNDAWVLARVCRRWRNVALNSPQLWSRIVLWVPGPNLKTERLLGLQRTLKIFLDRARCAPLCIRFQGSHILDVLDQLLPLASQWKEIELFELRDPFLSTLVKAGVQFTSLETLEIVSWAELLEGTDGTSTVDLRQSMPSLKHFVWDVQDWRTLRKLLLPWSQLRTCSIQCLRSIDFLWILSLLSADTHISFVDANDAFYRHGASNSDELTTSNIASLSICSGTFGAPVLQQLVAPRLQKLVVSHRNNGKAESHWNHTISFLNDGGFHLKHLRLQSSLGPTMKTEHLLEIIKSPRGHDLMRLDLYYISDPLHFLRTLANKDEWVPNLRTLALVGVAEVDVVNILAERNPIVRILDFPEWEWDFPEKIVENGLDVVILHRPYFPK